MKAKTILFTDVNQVAVDVANLPEPGPDEVLIESRYTCVSPGTELRCLAGEQPEMPAWPVIPGYALTGVVVERGSETSINVGTYVVCAGTQRVDRNRLWGGHISHAICNEASVYPVPGGVDLLDAAVSVLAAIAYHGVRVTRTALHEKIAVIGLGPIGQLSLRLHSLAGVHAVGCDRLPERVELARTAGLDAVLVEENLRGAIAPIFPDGADVVVDATGAPAVLREAIEVARELDWDDKPTPGPRYVIQGSYPGAVALPYQASFRKELSFLFPRNYQPRDLLAVLDLLGRGKLTLTDLVTAVATPEEAPQVYDRFLARDLPLMTAAFEWT